jgi:hypothetical protein
VLNDIRQFYFGRNEKVTKAIKTETKGMFGLFKKEKVEYVSETVLTAGENDGKMPVYLMFVTDGDNFDESAANCVLEAMKGENIYVMFVGIGTGAKFTFCRKAADEYNNVGFEHFADIGKTSDEALYEKLLNEEFCTWLKSGTVKTFRPVSM